MITPKMAYVHGATERPDHHEKAPEARLEDAINLLMQLKGPVVTMQILNRCIVKVARAELANREDS